MNEPQALAALLAERLAKFAPGTREYRIRRAMLDAVENSRDCRSTVLNRPDVAAKLCEPPLGYHRPHQWTGFIPPEMWAENRNDSPNRAALIALIEEAMSAP